MKGRQKNIYVQEREREKQQVFKKNCQNQVSLAKGFTVVASELPLRTKLSESSELEKILQLRSRLGWSHNLSRSSRKHVSCIVKVTHKLSLRIQEFQETKKKNHCSNSCPECHLYLCVENVLFFLSLLFCQLYYESFTSTNSNTADDKESL